MSNNRKDTLHELIKHMSKSEKRYFKVFSSRHTIGDENLYSTLFDYIDTMDDYDETKLFKHFRGKTFLNKFSITKKRLYDHIIASLDNYHSSNSIDAQIYKLLNSSDILFHKSLYHQSAKQLKSAGKLALKNNKFNLLSEISFKMKRIYERQGNVAQEELDLMFQEDIDYHKKSLSYDKIWNLKTKLFSLLSRKGISRSDEDLRSFKIIMDELLFSAKEEELYFDTKYLINHTYSAYYFAINSFEDCYTYLEENIRLLESDQLQSEVQISRYMSVITNAIYVSYRLNKKERIKELQTKLKKLSTNPNFSGNEDFQLRLFSNVYSIELTIYSLEGKNKEASQLLPLVENGLILYNEKLSEGRKAFFAFKIASIYFSIRDYHSALSWLNKLLNNNTLDQQEDIVSFAHLLTLLTHIEMKNMDFLPYILRSTSRYLKNKNRLYDFEQFFLKLITKLSKTKNEIDQEELWDQFYHDLSQLQDATMKRVAYEYFDFITWAKAKAQRKSFEILVQENNEKRLSA